MNSTDLFFAVLGAVLGANLLTVSFVWAMINISKREEERRDIPSVYWAGMLMPLAFCGVSAYIAFGGQ